MADPPARPGGCPCLHPLHARAGAFHRSGDPTVPGNELADGPGDRWVGAAVELPTLGLDARCCLGCACDGTLPTELWQRRLPRKEDVVSDWESSRVDGLVHTDAHLTRRWDEYRIEHFDPNSRNFTARMKLPNGAGYAEHNVEVHLVKVGSLRRRWTGNGGGRGTYSQ